MKRRRPERPERSERSGGPGKGLPDDVGADTKPEKTHLIRIRTEDVYGGMIPSRARRDAGLPELAASIARHGLLQPIVVRRNQAAGRYALICGARRLAACRQLGMQEMDAVLVSADRDEAILCFFEEMLCREQTSAMEEAEAARCADTADMPPCRAARHIHALQRLGVLPEAVRRAAYEARLSLEQLLPLLDVPDARRQLEAAAIIAQRGLTGAQASRLVHGPAQRETQIASGRRRMVKAALQEAARIAEQMRGQGIPAEASLQSGEKGLCIRILIQKEKFAGPAGE